MVVYSGRRGFVYAIAAENGLVKIGWSKDPIKRFYNLLCDCPIEVQLIGFIAASGKQERQIHDMLAPFRRHREWFELTGPVKTFVEALPRPMPQVVGDEPPTHPVAAWLWRNNLTQTAGATLFGVSNSHLSVMINKGRRPNSQLARNIETITKGEVKAADLLAPDADEAA